MQHGIVDEAGKRERRHRRELLRHGELFVRRHRRPFAEPLTDRAEVHGRFGMMRRYVDGLMEPILGRIVLANRLQHARDLKQQQRLVDDRDPRDVLVRIEASAPFQNGRPKLALHLKQPAKVDVRLRELGTDTQRVAHSDHGAGDIAGRSERHAIIEERDMQKFMIAVGGDPGLVELERPAGMPFAGQQLDGADKLPQG